MVEPTLESVVGDLAQLIVALTAAEALMVERLQGLHLDVASPAPPSEPETSPIPHSRGPNSHGPSGPGGSLPAPVPQSPPSDHGPGHERSAPGAGRRDYNFFSELDKQLAWLQRQSAGSPGERR